MTQAQIAALAAKYWADKLRATPTPQDQIRNAELETDIVREALMLCHWRKVSSCAQEWADNGKLEAFERELTSIIATELELGPVFLSVDYDACMFLCEAAERAGFKLTTFMLPWKHRMWVHPDNGVHVGEGYAEPLKPFVGEP